MTAPAIASVDEAWAALATRAAHSGFKATLTSGEDGQPSMTVSRWAMSKTFASASEIEAWLARVAGGTR